MIDKETVKEMKQDIVTFEWFIKTLKQQKAETGSYNPETVEGLEKMLDKKCDRFSVRTLRENDWRCR